MCDLKDGIEDKSSPEVTLTGTRVELRLEIGNIMVLIHCDSNKDVFAWLP